MMSARVVLLHAPRASAASWGEVPLHLAGLGWSILVSEIQGDDEPPFASRFIARTAVELSQTAAGQRLVLVGHGDAGPLLPQIGFARAAAGSPVDGYVFVDSDLPRTEMIRSRLDLIKLRAPVAAHRISERLATDPLRSYYEEELPLPEDWPDARCAYLQLSGDYDLPRATAAHRGWDVAQVPLHHTAALTDPEVVATALAQLLNEL